MVAVQQRLQIHGKSFLKNKAQGKAILQLNPLIKNCFIERVYKSNNTFGKFPLEVKTHNIKRVNLDKWKSLISWQNFNK